jgi:phage-related protein
MSGSIEELIVKAKPEGIDNVTEKFDQMKTSLAENKEEMIDTADSFGGLQERFQGALGAIVSGLAVAAGGLATQIPILGELMSGLGAVAQALAFQIDQVLRPVLSPLSKFLFKVSQAIFNADGAVGDLIGGITTLTGVAAVLIATAAKIGVLVGAWGSTFAGVVSILGTIVGAIGTVIGAILSLPGAIAIAIAAIIGFAAAYLTNFKGTRDKTNAIIGKIVKFVKNGFKKLKNKALSKIKTFAKKVKSKFETIKSDVETVINNLIDGAKEFGKDLIQKLIDGIKNKIPQIESALEDVPGGEVLLEGAGVLADGADTVENQTTQFVKGNTGGNEITLDGRTLNAALGRYGFDDVARR